MNVLATMDDLAVTLIEKAFDKGLGALTLVVLILLAYRVFHKGGLLDGMRDLHATLQKNDTEKTTHLGVATKELSRQSEAGRAYCKFLRAEIRTRSITDDSKGDLLAHVDEIERGLSK